MQRAFDLVNEQGRRLLRPRRAGWVRPERPPADEANTQDLGNRKVEVDFGGGYLSSGGVG